jgi:hypothetical protein
MASAAWSASDDAAASSAAAPATAAAAAEFDVRERMHVTCRLVKDFQQVVQLWAHR